MENSLKPKPFTRQDPLSNYFFIKVFGEKGDEGQLLGFLNAALDRTGDDRLVSVEILENKTFSAEYLGDKSSILDLRAQLQDGSRIGVEVQLSNLKNFDRRSLYYWSREFAAGIKEGQDYISLTKVIAINIVDFDYLETDKVHTIFHIWEDGNPRLLLTDVLEVHFLNMVKWRKLEGKDIEGDPLHQWLVYFDRNSPPELVEEVKKMNEGIQMADERMVYVTGDAEAIRAYEMRQMAIYDMNTRFREGIEEGRDQGHAEGLAKANLEIARKALAEGASIEFVQKITGLSTEDIETL